MADTNPFDGLDLLPSPDDEDPFSRWEMMPDPVQYSKADSAVGGAVDTFTFGLADEAAAGIGWAVNQIHPRGDSRSYESELARIRGQLASAQEQNPKSYMAGQVAGGVGSGLILAPVSASAAAGRAGAALAPRVAAGVLDGTVAGGLYGASSGEGLEGRALEAAKGAGIGAFTGAAFPLLASGASRAFEVGRNAMQARPIAQAANASPDGLRLLGGILDADGSLGPRGAANMAAAGPEAMLADAGPMARSVLDTAIQRAGPGGIAAREAIEARAGRSAQDIVSALDNSLGAPQGVNATRAGIAQGSAAARGSAYDAAYAAPIDYAAPSGQELQNMIAGRVPGSIIAEANRLMQLGGDQSRQILARIADDGSVTYERLPDVRQIDYITRALNQAAESGEGQGALGGQTTLGRAYQGLAREIRDTLRQSVPEYGTALETAADPIRRSQAVRTGSRIFSAGREDFLDEVAGMTGPERAAAAQGIRSQIDDRMANVSRALTDDNMDAREAVKGLKDLSSRANREKLAAVLGQEEADALLGRLDQATTSFNLRARVTDNSRTYARQATDAQVKQLTEPGIVRTAARGDGIQAGKRIVQALTGETSERQVARENAVYDEIARLLTRTGGAGQQTYDAVRRIGQTDAATQLISDRIVRALGGPHLSYPLSTQLLGTEGRR